jgi:hypothetical protein
MNKRLLLTSDLKKIFKLFNRKIGYLILTFFFLYIDSESLAKRFEYSQLLTNALMLVMFSVVYARSVQRTKQLMLYSVIVAFLGEYFFSVFLDMYSYRLRNVPLYVPLGHAVIFARVFMFSKEPLVKQNQKVIARFLYVVISLFSFVYLYYFNDVFGFVMTLGVFFFLYKRQKEKVFFLTMYIVVALLEISGTYYKCWSWPNTAFRIFDFLPSNNPPSGISLFYFILSWGSFVTYKRVHFKAWSRLKKLRKLNNVSS